LANIVRPFRIVLLSAVSLSVCDVAGTGVRVGCGRGVGVRVGVGVAVGLAVRSCTRLLWIYAISPSSSISYQIVFPLTALPSTSSTTSTMVSGRSDVTTLALVDGSDLTLTA